MLIFPVEPETVGVRPAPRLLRSVWGKGIRAMTLRNTILVDPSMFEGRLHQAGRLLVHELVHVRQWHELGVLGFLGRYLRGYLGGRWAGLSHGDAYQAIDLECEARRVTDLAG
jgi:hypothetical protein